METKGTTPITFRHANPSDHDRIATLHTASWRSAYRGILADTYLDGPIKAERAQRWLLRLTTNQPDRQLVLFAERTADQNLLGFVCVLLDDDPAWGACLDNLHVRPDLTGAGIGRLLLVHAARWVSLAAPDSALHLWVFAANIQAQRFYERMGGETVEQVIKPMPDGGTIPSLRYVWRDLHDLAAMAVTPSFISHSP